LASPGLAGSFWGGVQGIRQRAFTFHAVLRNCPSPGAVASFAAMVTNGTNQYTRFY